MVTNRTETDDSTSLSKSRDNSESNQANKELEDRYMKILKKYKELKHRSDKEIHQDFQDVKQQEKKVKVLEDKLAATIEENQRVKIRLEEVEKLTSGRVGKQTSKELQDTGLLNSLENEISRLQDKLKQVEETVQREVKCKETEYKEKLKECELSFKIKEKDLRKKISQLKGTYRKPSESSVTSRSKSKSDRTPSPLNMKRLLGGIGGTHTSNSSTKLKVTKDKKLEELLLRVGKEYKEMKEENREMNSKLEKIERMLERIESNNNNTSVAKTGQIHRNSSVKPKIVGDDDLLLDPMEVIVVEQSDKKDLKDFDQEFILPEVQRPSASHKSEFFAPHRNQQHSSMKNLGPVERGSAGNGGKVVGWTGQYNDFLSQINKMKEEIKELNNENTDMAAMIQNKSFK